jgi:NhaP-type Na+/H+ or K+/H+ antiporter
MLVVVTQLVVTAVAAESVHDATTGEAGLIVEAGTDGHQDEEHEEYHPVHAVFFAPFILTLGVIVFFLLSRFAPALPYTAVMFFIGTLMGIAATLIEEQGHIQDSLDLWIGIDSEVLLLVFLPGLIYRDSVGLNPHLFWIALPQLFIFAFPLVLAGTVLTALIGFYFFPHNWSFNLAMTFGSILSATDPVAVAALLEEVGAPPRLKVHVAGESLLNDGSAIVFYAIFSKMFFFDIGIKGGVEVGWVAGIGLFCRKALGGVAIGIAFGLILLLLLLMLNRRFNREENVVAVVATVAIAYMGFYVAEIVCATSGVMSTVATGLMIKFFGSGLVSDPKLMEDFWTLVEHLLNAILFSLGGVVWGAVVTRDTENGNFTGKDWGYLILLYVLLTLMRGLMFLAVFPVIDRIGLKTTWQEAVFQVHGGLRVSWVRFCGNSIVCQGTDLSSRVLPLCWACCVLYCSCTIGRSWNRFVRVSGQSSCSKRRVQGGQSKHVTNLCICGRYVT